MKEPSSYVLLKDVRSRIIGKKSNSDLIQFFEEKKMGEEEILLFYLTKEIICEEIE